MFNPAGSSIPAGRLEAAADGGGSIPRRNAFNTSIVIDDRKPWLKKPHDSVHCWD